MVPLKGIQKAHSRMAYNCVHQLVNLRHRERVFWACFVQVCKIYTYTSLPRLLLYHHGVGQPFRVKNLFNSPSLLKFHHLVLYNIRMFLGQTSRWLLPGGSRWDWHSDDGRWSLDPLPKLRKHSKQIYQCSSWETLLAPFSPEVAIKLLLEKLFRIVTNEKFLLILTLGLLGWPLRK